MGAGKWEAHLRNSCRHLRIVHVLPEVAQVSDFSGAKSILSTYKNKVWSTHLHISWLCGQAHKHYRHVILFAVWRGSRTGLTHTFVFLMEYQTCSRSIVQDTLSMLSHLFYFQVNFVTTCNCTCIHVLKISFHYGSHNWKFICAGSFIIHPLRLLPLILEQRNFLTWPYLSASVIASKVGSSDT